ncbi:hypothetical protein K5I29_07560 [Flavobacterium agricola]|uniref:Outer membrane protein transport protein (OMPP1/FadL/TodX) n=1 Tax=Flavobacterium agricola TaxID=2870839 RepID=A0ABY6LZT6_9FLAO|nr:hypothetical protein [Flavobacterium agricola]UYW00418.1 hypothetical protein K5I29_07560 [Flavobacterium agricola]
MKKYSFIIALLLGASNLTQAQSTVPRDGLRYSNTDLNGTARFNAMGGAFGAVGGDLSAISINPAGSSFFNNNQAAISLKYSNNQNKSTYLGNQENKNSSLFDLNQAGIVFVFSNPEATLNKFAFAVNFENQSNFKNKFNFGGNNTNSDISDYFLYYANGENGLGVFPLNYATDYNFGYFGNFADQQAWLGYNSYILDYDGSQYFSNIPIGSGIVQTQQKYVNQRGYNSKLQLNFSGAVKDKFFFGINLNPHFTNYEKNFSISEHNSGFYPNSITVNDVIFDNYVATTGGGFSLDLGAIYKITDNVRIGASYASPTWYRLTDETRQGIYTIRTEETDPNKFISNSLYPNVTTVFESYNFRTAGKFTGSIAGVINNRWVLSGDVSVSDYSKMRYSTNGFENINEFYKNNLDTALEYRVGTEYLIGNVALRAGYRFVESPYKKDVYAPTGDTSSISGGIGFNFGSNKLDLSYSYTDRKFSEEFITSANANAASIKNINNAVSLTYTINF